MRPLVLKLIVLLLSFMSGNSPAYEGDKQAMSEPDAEYCCCCQLPATINDRARDKTFEIPPEAQGYVFGRIVYEIIGIETTLAKAGNLSKLERLERIKAKLPQAPDSPFKFLVDSIEEAAAFLRKYEGMCFVAGTPVLTQRGLLPIEAITPGMYVWSRDEHRPREGWKRVIDTFVTRPSELYHLTYRTTGPPGRHTITGTGTHPFWVGSQQKFVPAKALRAGDILLTAAGGEALLEEIRIETAPGDTTFTTYNFEVEDYHTYFAGPEPLWVHNSGDHCSKMTAAFERMLKLKASNGNIRSADEAADWVVGLRRLAQDEGWYDQISSENWNKAEGTIWEEFGKSPLALPPPSGLLAITVQGVSAQRIINGTNGKIAIIGRSMGDFPRRGVYGVVDYARELRSRGFQTELFAGPRLSARARDEMAALRRLHGGNIPDTEIPQTLAYQENLQWAAMVKREEYTLVDIGDPNNAGYSPFYFAEKNILFGD